MNIKYKDSGATLLYAAVTNYSDKEEAMVKLLLKNGAHINEKSKEGKTALHGASNNCAEPEVLVPFLLELGADVNILDDYGETPFTVAEDFEVKVIFVKELAKLKFENQFICDRNLEYLEQNENLIGIFQNCLEELSRMKNHKIYNNFSLYDIFKMRKQNRRLVFMTKNEEFVEAFRLLWNRQLFQCYGKYLDGIFEKALGKGNILLTEEKKLRSVLKNILPDLIIHRVAYFANENLFFDLYDE